MAILTLPARDYANMLESAVGMRSLKIRRQVEQLRAKKRAKNITRMNLTQEQASELTGVIYSSLFSYMNKEELRDLLDSYVEKELGTEPPCVIYSMSEWKAVVEIATGLQSNIDLQKFGNWNIYFNFKNIAGNMYPHILTMVAAAHGIVHEDISIAPYERTPQEGETRYNHVDEQVEQFENGEWIKAPTLDQTFAAQFGAVVTEEGIPDEDGNQADSNNG